MRRASWISMTLAAVLALGLGSFVAWAPEEAEAQPGSLPWSYAVKFVCGFNSSNIGFDLSGAWTGEATVKLGNYATDVNIFNPSFDTQIEKKVLVLYDGQFLPPRITREPDFVLPIGGEGLVLPHCAATMDDCNKIYQLAGIPPGLPPPLVIGFLVIQSEQPLDVTAVYTAEVCTDWSATGGADMRCSNASGARGAGISIDVEQIEGKQIF